MLRHTDHANDADLAAVISTARSWRDAGRRLELRSLSGYAMRKLKERVRRLGIDTSHFIGQRSYSDRQLTTAVQSADTWTDVVRALGLSERGDTRLRLKGHAVRLGIDVTALDPRPQQPARELTDLAPSPSHLSAVAESIAAAWFGARGIPVATPVQHRPYDLLAHFGGREQRIQVKSTAFRGTHGTWMVGIGQRPYVLDKSASRQPYDPDDLDYFLIIDGDYLLYLIPTSVVAGRTTISVGAYTAYKVGDASSLFATSSA